MPVHGQQAVGILSLYIHISIYWKFVVWLIFKNKTSKNETDNEAIVPLNIYLRTEYDTIYKKGRKSESSTIWVFRWWCYFRCCCNHVSELRKKSIQHINYSTNIFQQRILGEWVKYSYIFSKIHDGIVLYIDSVLICSLNSCVQHIRQHSHSKLLNSLACRRIIHVLYYRFHKYTMVFHVHLHHRIVSIRQSAE